MPKVSVIIPVFKVEQYLSTCVDSLLAQTFEDWECVLVDDGSPDGSGALCDEYAAKDRRFHAIHKENGGVSSARNVGLERVSGTYIYFMDSDDYVEPDALDILVREMEQGYDMVSFNFVRELPDGTVLRYSPFKHGIHSFSSNEECFSFACGRFLDYEFGHETCFRMFRRDIIEKYHIRYCEESRLGEDMLFSLEYLLHCQSYKVLPDRLYHYIKREGTLLTASQDKNHFITISKMFAHLQEHVERDFLSDIRQKFLPLLMVKLFEMEFCGKRDAGMPGVQIAQRAFAALTEDQKVLLRQFIKKAWSYRSIIGKTFALDYQYDVQFCLSNGSFWRAFPYYVISRSLHLVRKILKNK